MIYFGLYSETKAIDLTLFRKSLFSPTQLVSKAEVSLVSNHIKERLFFYVDIVNMTFF